MNNIKVEDLLLHPVRMRILLSLAGHELTSREISSRLPDVAHATLYRHIGKLEKAGEVLPVWEAEPFLWLLHHTESKAEDYDYKAITDDVISNCSDAIKVIVGRLTPV